MVSYVAYNSNNKELFALKDSNRQELEAELKRVRLARKQVNRLVVKTGPRSKG